MKEAIIICDPSKGSIVTHTGWQQDENIYPCDVYIVSGEYLDSQFGRLSNFWRWRRVLDNGKLGKLEEGYGSFVESNIKYKVEIQAIRKDATQGQEDEGLIEWIEDQIKVRTVRAEAVKWDNNGLYSMHMNKLEVYKQILEKLLNK